MRCRRPRRKSVQENQDFGNPCTRSDVDGPRFIDSAQRDAVRFVGVDDQSLVEVQKIVHPGPSFLNFGRVRIPGSSGSRFVPLTQVASRHC